MSSRKRILVLSFTDHVRDPRVFRQIKALEQDAGWELHAAGKGREAPGSAAKHICLERVPASLPGQLLRAAWLKAGMFERYYWNMLYVPDALRKIPSDHYDLIIANDLETLPLALRLAGKRGKVWLDAHEYAPRQVEERWQFRFFFMRFWDYIARVYLPRVDHMTTVGLRIGQEYQARYGVASDLLINAPLYVEQSPTAVDPAAIRLVHHGGTNAGRRLERMVEMMRYVDARFSLDLYLMVNDRRGMAKIEQAAAGLSNVHIRAPVPMPEIPARLNSYDIGLSFIWPMNFNYEFSLPNKLFEYLQARLAVAIWPSPEMRRVIEPERVGWVIDSYEAKAMADVLNALTAEQIEACKSASESAAEKYNAQQTMAQILATTEQLLG